MIDFGMWLMKAGVTVIVGGLLITAVVFVIALLLFLFIL